MAVFIWVGSTSSVFNDGDNWLGGEFSDSVPEAGDDLYYVADYPAACTGSSTLAFGALVVEDGYTAALSLNSSFTSVDFSGTGDTTLDVRSSAITLEIKQTATGGAGTKGLYIRGDALTGINIESGSVGIAHKPGDTSVVGELRVISGDVEVGSGVTLTTCYNFGAAIDIAASVTTIHVKNGTTNLIESAAATTVDCLRGEFVLDSSGTVASLFVDTQGAFSATAGDDKTITALSFAPGANLSWYPSNMTIGTFTLPSDPITLRTDSI
jgi:hypothetical protein